MLITINCNHLDDEQHKAVEQILNRDKNVKDWICHLKSGWIADFKGQSSDDLRDKIKKVVDSKNVFINYLSQGYNGWLDSKVWEFVAKYEISKKPVTSPEQTNTDKKEHSDLIGPEDFIITTGANLDDLVLDNETTQSVQSYFRHLQFMKAAASHNVILPERAQNTVITGRPGVGKTTLAKALGLKLADEDTSGQKVKVYFVKPAQLIGAWRGHTQKNMQRLLEHARDGIVIFDEIDSYLALDSDDRKILNVLNTHMSDQPNKPLVIATLYETKLEEFYNFNSGFRRRFKNCVSIAKQDSISLSQIFESQLKTANLDFDPAILPHFERLISDVAKAHGANFGHIGEIDNLFAAVVEHMAARHAEQPETFEFKVLVNDIPERDPITGKLKNRDNSAKETTGSKVVPFNVR